MGPIALSVAINRFPVLTCRCVETTIGEPEPFHRLSAHDMRFDDLVDVGLGDVSVPDGFRIDDDVRPVLALIQASGLVGADAAFESALGQLLLEEFLQLGFGRGIAASARIACRALVPANEDVMFEFRHISSTYH